MYLSWGGMRLMMCGNDLPLPPGYLIAYSSPKLTMMSRSRLRVSCVVKSNGIRDLKTLKLRTSQALSCSETKLQ